MLDIRPFTPADLEGLYAVSLATGHQGGDATHLYGDGKLIGHIYSAPYAVLEPKLALVVEDEFGVAGFAVGTPNTDAWFQQLEREWWPKLRDRYADPISVPPGDWSPDQRRAFMIHHPSPTPRQISEHYPAHMHLNLAPRIQGKGIGSLLFSRWITNAAEHGVTAIHIGTNPANERAISFWSKRDFIRLPAQGSTVWMGRT